MKKKILFLLMCIFPTLLVAQKSLLHFRDSKFVIAQFTDLHWTPTSPKCSETTATIRAVLESEKPDLAVLTGDVVTDTPAGEGWMAVATLFNEAEIPFVVVMGNHDAEYMEKDAIYDLLLKFPFYVGQKGPENITGCGNCVLPIYDSKEKEQNLSYQQALDVSSDRHGVAYTYYEGNCKRVSDIASCNRLQEGVMPTISIEEAIAKLYIDGQVVVDNDGGHSGYRADGKIALEKGFHELCVSYFEDYMGQELEVGYSGRNVLETSLTENLLFLPTDESNLK